MRQREFRRLEYDCLVLAIIRLLPAIKTSYKTMGKQRYRHKNTGEEGFIEGETLTSQNATVRFNPVKWDGQQENLSGLYEDVQMSDLIPVKRPGDNAP